MRRGFVGTLGNAHAYENSDHTNHANAGKMDIERSSSAGSQELRLSGNFLRTSPNGKRTGPIADLSDGQPTGEGIIRCSSTGPDDSRDRQFSGKSLLE